MKNYPSRILEIAILMMGVYSFYKNDILWGFACMIGFVLSMSPVLIKRNLNFSIPWIIEFLLAFVISLHIWGGVLSLYSIPLYDKFAHFLASAIIAFFALIVIYIMDVYSTRIHMDLIMVAFFISIFTIAIGALWEIAEFSFDQIFSHGIPVAQVSLQDTMTDLIADSIAGIFVGIAGAIGIRRGEFKELFLQIGKEVEKLNRQFFENKRRAIEKLQKAMEMKKVDERAKPIIDKINSLFDYFTTSSCSGRIVLLEIPSAGRKRKARFLGKWHEEVKIENVMEAIKKARHGEIWFLVQSPIFHVSTISIKNARILLNAAIQSGFKYSSIKALNGKIVVEILSTEKMDVPVGKDGNLYVSKEYMEMLVNISNMLLRRMHKKLSRLDRKLKEMQNILMAS